MNVRVKGIYSWKEKGKRKKKEEAKFKLKKLELTKMASLLEFSGLDSGKHQHSLIIDRETLICL